MRQAGAPVINYALPFGDVAEDAWYADAARWAAAEKIVPAEAGSSLSPDEKITREETALLMHRAAIAQGMDVSVGENTNILSYDDAFDISEGYASALQWAVGAGVFQGDGTINFPFYLKRAVSQRQPFSV